MRNRGSDQPEATDESSEVAPASSADRPQPTNRPEAVNEAAQADEARPVDGAGPADEPRPVDGAGPADEPRPADEAGPVDEAGRADAAAQADGAGRGEGAALVSGDGSEFAPAGVGAPTTGEEAAEARLPLFRSDAVRLAIAFGASLVLVTAGYVIAGQGLVRSGRLTVEVVTSPAGLAVLYLAFWIVYCLIYSIATLHTFGRADGTALALWFRESRAARRRRQVIEVLMMTSGPAGSVSLCLAALLAVVVFATSAEFRGNPLLIFLAFLVVAFSWMLVVISYAVHYARENSNEGGLAFPGAEKEGPPVFADYVYLAVQIGTTFSTSDIEVDRRPMRRTVTTHSIVAFGYNTVVIALIVSVFLNAIS